MTWWAWMILGAVLFGAEIFAIDAQFYLVFLGLSAGLVGLLGLTGIATPEWVEWLVFAAIALVSMFTFRRSLYRKLRGDAPGFKAGVSGEYLVVPADLAAGSQGRANFRGSDWTVVNDSGRLIAAGSRVKIVRNDGLTLYVSPDTNTE
jgi:membrane protein implicated in regulation of membrane protease activity